MLAGGFYERTSGAAGQPVVGYRRRAPEQTVLHQLVTRYAQTMIAELRDADGEGGGLPRDVERELAAYLRCGILAHGFARVRCGTCGDEIVVAFSCKRRGICPSCTARRMADTAAHLVDRVLPRAPYRQWVFTVPKPLRLVLARDPRWTSWIGGLVVRAALKRTFGHRGSRRSRSSRCSWFGDAMNAYRERRGDLGPLVASLTRELAQKLELPVPAISSSLLARLEAHDWPGNVRELMNSLETAMILGRGDGLELPDEFSRRAKRELASGAPRFESAVRVAIEEALRATRGKIYGSGGAASRLGLKPGTLQSKVRKLGIERNNFV